MKHLGDITKIDGRTVPVTDVVVGGSPCQGEYIARISYGKDSLKMLDVIHTVEE